MIARSKKKIAAEFLTLYTMGKSCEVFGLHSDKNFKHHKAYFKGNANTLMLAMEENAKQNPNKVFEIKHALEDKSLAALHSHVR
jgi:hypothetical protein